MRFLRSVTLVFLLAVSNLGWAQSLEVIGPSGLVAPDGFTIAVLEHGGNGVPIPNTHPGVSAEGAQITGLAARPPLLAYWLTPSPGAREVRVLARDGTIQAEARFVIGPPAARVEMTLTPRQPVKNRDPRAQLRVRLLRADGAIDPDSPPPVLQTNIGSVSALTATGPGEYQATYELPSTLYPEVAVIAAFAPWPHPQSIYGALGRLLVPMPSAIDLPGHTKPYAQMSIEIAGQSYGPVEAGRDGRFKLPVIVPPGHRFGVGTAIDRLNHKRVRKVDLMLPPTDQLSCVMNPGRLPADGVSRARIVCATSDVFGNATPTARVTLTVRRGTASAPRSLDDGMQEWIYTAPKGPVGEDAIEASWKQPGSLSRTELKVDLVQGPAAKLTLNASEKLIHYGGQLFLEGSVLDAQDRPRAGAVLHFNAALGVFDPITLVGAGRFQTTWTPPPNGTAAAAELGATASGPPGADPARLQTWVSDHQLYARVTDLAGLPVPTQKLRVNGHDRVTGEDGILLIGPAKPGRTDIGHAQWTGLRDWIYVLDDGKGFPSLEPRVAARASAEVTLAPPIPVNVRLAVAGRQVTYWVEDAKGRLLGNRQLEVKLSGGSRSVEMHDGERASFLVSATSPVTVSVEDVRTGVTALAEVSP